MSKNEIEIKASLSREQTARYLQELAQCVTSGKVVVQRGSEHLELRPPQSLEMEIEAQRKKDKARISLEITWRLEDQERAAEEFKISSEPPAMAGCDPPALQIQAPAPQAEQPAPSSSEEAETPAPPKKEKASRSSRK